MQAEALCATPPQANHTVTPTHIEPEQYNSLNNDIIKASDIKLVSLYSAMFSVFHVTPKRYGQYKIFIFSEIFHSYVITVVLAAVFMKFCIFWDTIYIYLLGHYIYLLGHYVYLLGQYVYLPGHYVYILGHYIYLLGH